MIDRRPPAGRALARAAAAALAVVLALAGCSATSSGTATGSGTPGTSAAGGATGASGSRSGTPGRTPGGGPTGGASSAPPGKAPVPVLPDTGFRTLKSGVGTLVATTFTGPKSKVRMRLWVWLPPQYGDPAFATTKFPAVMLYPGGSGAGYNTWAGPLYGAQQYVAKATATPGGKVVPMIFVMPQMQLSEKLDTECADLPGQPKVGTFLADDVRDLVLKTFRVSPDKRSWAAAGASSGAYCATRLVFNRPEQYSAVVSIDGYFQVQTTLKGGTSPAVRATDPDRLATTAPPDVAVLLWVGSTTRTDAKRAQTFLAALRQPTRGELRTLPGGRHLTKDFAKMMPDVFTWLSGQLTPPA